MTEATLWGQKDTEFWFAAPEITTGQGALDYDRPVTFRVSTYENAATVTLTQPANPASPTQSIFLPPNTSGEISSAFFNITDTECTPPNIVQNHGFLITATTPITAYYEVIGGCKCNPEIFSMKGKNALGKEFYVPFQTYLPNSTNPNHLPIPRSSFDIVATEDGTSVTITPTQAIVGHGAGTTFTITLQKGQTWAGEAIGWQPDQHPSGTHLVANKPIAVTIEDDLLRGVVFGGTCSDLMGDQIIPVSKMGKRYIVQKGFLTGTEKAFVVGTVAGTQLKVNGLFAGIVGAGETFVVDIDGGQYFIEATEPVTVLQMTGNGCEVAGEIIPPLDCTGSTSVRFVRPTNEPFWLEVTTRAGFEGGFMLNGDPSLIPASAFTVVPGSGGEFVAAVLPFDVLDVPSQFSSIVENSLGKFHVGFLCGETFATGTRFGFFSDFNNQTEVQDSVFFCEGDTIISHGITITEEGVFTQSTSNAGGCDTLFTIKSAYLPFILLSESLSFCANDTAVSHGILISQPGIYKDTLSGGLGCDTILTLLAFANPLNLKEVQIDFCQGDTVVSYGHVFTESALIFDTLSSLNDCDTALTIVATAHPLPTSIKNIALCPGDSVVIAGVQYGSPNTVSALLPAIGGGCDTLATFIITETPTPTLTRNIALCPGDSVVIAGVHYGSPNTVSALLPAAGSGCDTMATFFISQLPLPTVAKNIHLCPGESINISGIPYGSPATVSAMLPAAGMGCDTLATYFITQSILSLSLPDTITTHYNVPVVLPLQVTATFSTEAQWSPAQGLDSPILQNPTATATESIEYQVEITDSTGCRAVEDVLLFIEFPDCKTSVYLPNVFSPNQDGNNDQFTIYTNFECVSKVNLLRIYDRWGELLFERFDFLPNEESLGWDGIFRKKAASPGVYVYYIEMEYYDGRVEKRKGDVTLIR